MSDDSPTAKLRLIDEGKPDRASARAARRLGVALLIAAALFVASALLG